MIVKKMMCTMFGFSLTMFAFVFTPTKFTVGGGYADDIIEGKAALEEEIRNSYSSKKDFTMTLKSEKIIVGCDNLDQNELNNDYNDDKNTKYQADNSCSVVAATNLVEYFGDTACEYTTGSSYEEFRDLYTGCRKRKWTSSNNGTMGTKHNNILSLGFSQNGSSRRGDNDWFDVRKKVRKYVNRDEPVILSLRDHAVVACGVIKYEIKYSEKKRCGFLWLKTKTVTTTETKEYFIINEGWGNDEKSYVDSSLINNVFTLNIVTFSE